MVRNEQVARLEACGWPGPKRNFWEVASIRLAKAMRLNKATKVLIAINKNLTGVRPLSESILYREELRNIADAMRPEPAWNPVFEIYDVMGNCVPEVGLAIEFLLEELANRSVQVRCRDCTQGLQQCRSELQKPKGQLPDPTCAQGDCRNGLGKLQTWDGDQYEGHFKDGNFNGKGLLRLGGGQSYEGDFEDDLPHGKGIYRYENGDSYEGTFKDGLRNGAGIFRYESGDIYEGGFKDDLRHGEGRYQYADGSSFEGVWKDGKRIDSSTSCWWCRRQ